MKITFEFATHDDCLEKMVPSDLRELVAERDKLLEYVNDHIRACVERGDIERLEDFYEWCKTSNSNSDPTINKGDDTEDRPVVFEPCLICGGSDADFDGFCQQCEIPLEVVRAYEKVSCDPVNEKTQDRESAKKKLVSAYKKAEELYLKTKANPQNGDYHKALLIGSKELLRRRGLDLYSFRKQSFGAKRCRDASSINPQ